MANNNDRIVFMGRLTAEERKEMPAEEYGEPKEKKYPMPDRSHAANAKGRAKQMLKKGVISDKEYGKIVSKSDKKLEE